MKMNKDKTWMYGIRVIESEKNFFLEGIKKIIPEEVGLNKSPQFEECYIWLWFYFNKIRKCDRCGKPACSKGLIRYMNSDKTKILAYVCKECGRSISEIKERSRKFCHKCESKRLMNGNDCRTCYKSNEKYYTSYTSDIELFEKALSRMDNKNKRKRRKKK